MLLHGVNELVARNRIRSAVRGTASNKLVTTIRVVRRSDAIGEEPAVRIDERSKLHFASDGIKDAFMADVADHPTLRRTIFHRVSVRALRRIRPQLHFERTAR